MSFPWKASGITYNRYLAVAARVVRRSLKEDKRLEAEKRGESDMKIAKWSGGKPGTQEPLHEVNHEQMKEQTSGSS